jgi:hypothetical protein
VGSSGFFVWHPRTPPRADDVGGDRRPSVAWFRDHRHGVLPPLRDGAGVRSRSADKRQDVEVPAPPARVASSNTRFAMRADVSDVSCELSQAARATACAAGEGDDHERPRAGHGGSASPLNPLAARASIAADHDRVGVEVAHRCSSACQSAAAMFAAPAIRTVEFAVPAPTHDHERLSWSGSGARVSRRRAWDRTPAGEPRAPTHRQASTGPFFAYCSTTRLH